MQVIIDRAENARIGDVIVTAVHNPDYDRGIHLVGKILEIDNPHPEIVESIGYSTF